MRIVMVDLSTHLRRAVKKRWANATVEEKKESARRAVKGFWAKLSPEERSAEMRRRAAKRKRNKVKAKSK
jgi:hypothetical protein